MKDGVIKKIKSSAMLVSHFLTYAGLLLGAGVMTLAVVSTYSSFFSHISDEWLRRVGAIALSIYAAGIVLNILHALITRGD